MSKLCAIKLAPCLIRSPPYSPRRISISCSHLLRKNQIEFRNLVPKTTLDSPSKSVAIVNAQRSLNGEGVKKMESNFLVQNDTCNTGKLSKSAEDATQDIEPLNKGSMTKDINLPPSSCARYVQRNLIGTLATSKNVEHVFIGVSMNVSTNLVRLVSDDPHQLSKAAKHVNLYIERLEAQYRKKSIETITFQHTNRESSLRTKFVFEHLLTKVRHFQKNYTNVHVTLEKKHIELASEDAEELSKAVKLVKETIEVLFTQYRRNIITMTVTTPMEYGRYYPLTRFIVSGMMGKTMQKFNTTWTGVHLFVHDWQIKLLSTDPDLLPRAEAHVRTEIERLKTQFEQQNSVVIDLPTGCEPRTNFILARLVREGRKHIQHIKLWPDVFFDIYREVLKLSCDNPTSLSKAVEYTKQKIGRLEEEYGSMAIERITFNTDLVTSDFVSRNLIGGGGANIGRMRDNGIYVFVVTSWEGGYVQLACDDMDKLSKAVKNVKQKITKLTERYRNPIMKRILSVDADPIVCSWVIIRLYWMLNSGELNSLIYREVGTTSFITAYKEHLTVTSDDSKILSATANIVNQEIEKIKHGYRPLKFVETIKLDTDPATTSFVLADKGINMDMVRTIWTKVYCVVSYECIVLASNDQRQLSEAAAHVTKNLEQSYAKYRNLVTEKITFLSDPTTTSELLRRLFGEEGQRNYIMQLMRERTGVFATIHDDHILLTSDDPNKLSDAVEKNVLRAKECLKSILQEHNFRVKV